MAHVHVTLQYANYSVFPTGRFALYLSNTMFFGLALWLTRAIFPLLLRETERYDEQKYEQTEQTSYCFQSEFDNVLSL